MKTERGSYPSPQPAPSAATLQAGPRRVLELMALTGWGQEQDRSRSREVGFDVHLVKPVDYPALLALLAGPRPAAAPVRPV